MRLKAYVFIVLLVVITLMSVKGGVISIVGYRSPSPENYGLLGSSQIPVILASEGHKVELGGPYDVTPSSVYIVIAPEKAFSEIEVLTIKSFVKRGGVLLVADETGVANSLVEDFGIKVAGIYVIANDTRGHGWDEVVRVSCTLGNKSISFITTRVSYIERYPEWARPVCWVDDPRVPEKYVIGVYGVYGKGKVLIISDSTVFSNFLTRGIYPQLGRTDQVVKELVNFISPSRKAKIVIEDKHYNLMFVKLSSLPHIIITLLSSGISSLQKTLEKARAYRASIALLSLAGGLAFLLIGPPHRIVLRSSEDEERSSAHALGVISKYLDFLGNITGNPKLKVLALELSEVKVSSYSDARRFARRILKRLGELGWR